MPRLGAIGLLENPIAEKLQSTLGVASLLVA